MRVLGLERLQIVLCCCVLTGVGLRAHNGSETVWVVC